jgi:hypothetical protein
MAMAGNLPLNGKGGSTARLLPHFLSTVIVRAASGVTIVVASSPTLMNAKYVTWPCVDIRTAPCRLFEMANARIAFGGASTILIC